MAAVPRAVQMITRDSQNKEIDRVFMRREVQDLIDSWDLQAPNSRYTVVSVIGPQSTGKSTLMNKVFQAGFEVSGSNNYLRRQTTKGIWVTVSNHPRAIVIDSEGSDGIEQQDDIGFENQGALFVLLMSDVIIINLWQNEINRLHSGFHTLTTIFQELTNHVPRQTKMIFALRDYNGRGTYSEYKDFFNTRLNEIWRRIHRNGNFTLIDYVEIHVELFPSAVEKFGEFEKKCAALCEHLAGGEFGRRIEVLPAQSFPNSGADLWEKILRNERLQLPSHTVMMSRKTCETIMKEILQTELAQLLQTDHRSSPKLFLIALENNIRQMLSQYEHATSTYNRDIVNEMKEMLETSIVKNNKPAFQRTLKRSQQKFFEKTKKEITARMKYSFMPNNLVQSLVQDYNLQYGNTIADLDRYREEIKMQKQKFLDDLTCFAEQKAAEIVAARWTVFRKVMIGAAVVGACIGTAFAFYCLVKFGAPVAVAVTRQSLPYIQKALELLKHSAKNTPLVFDATCKVLRSSWSSIANVITVAATSTSSDRVNEFIDILQGATSADKKVVRLLVILVLAAAKASQNSQAQDRV